jgi:hypothetical protein
MISFFYNDFKKATTKMVDAPGDKYIFKLFVWSEDLVCFIKVISNLHNADRGFFEKSCYQDAHQRICHDFLLKKDLPNFCLIKLDFTTSLLALSLVLFKGSCCIG